MSQFLPGTMFLIDTSAATRITDTDVRNAMEGLIDDGLVATCVTVDLEAAFAGRNAKDVEKILRLRREHLIQLAITETIADRAREVAELLASRGLHRAAGTVDILTAAVAEHHRAIVVHYDADFEHIASVTGQQHQWIVPRGSVD